MDKLLSTFIKRAENTLYKKIVVCDKIFVISKLIKNCFEKSIFSQNESFNDIKCEYFYSEFTNFKILINDLICEIIPLENREKISYSNDKNMLGESDINFLMTILNPIKILINYKEKTNAKDPRSKILQRPNITSLNPIKWYDKNVKIQPCNEPSFDEYSYKLKKYNSYFSLNKIDEYSKDTHTGLLAEDILIDVAFQENSNDKPKISKLLNTPLNNLSENISDITETTNIFEEESTSANEVSHEEK